MKQLLFVFTALTIFSCSPKEWEAIADGAKDILSEGQTPSLSNADVISGLKEALEVGIKNGAGKASNLDGFWKNPLIKIPFPEEAIKVKNTLTDLGLTGPVNDFEMTLNRAAEEASKEAVPVFVDAIKGMSISDGWAILKGDKNAATQFLRDKTTAKLLERFAPITKSAIDKVELTKYWNPLATKYNSIPLVTPVNPDLDKYVTERAISGLFLLVEKEEAKIRENPAARVTDLLKRVFAEQD